ncbi:MAG: signal peptidase II [Verrucomicrobiae bacterium]|nr:signal peptidase II [Verrucomicrobiae bacterium]
MWKNRNRPDLPALCLGILVFILDQASKQMALAHLAFHEPVPVIPGFFNLTLLTNTGAAWGIMRDKGLWLTLLAAGALLFLILNRRSFIQNCAIQATAYGLLLGGIAGNLTDRLVYGHVVDFLDFRFAGWPWPAFNLADSAICCGVGLYLLNAARTSKQPMVTPGASEIPLSPGDKPPPQVLPDHTK